MSNVYEYLKISSKVRQTIWVSFTCVLLLCSQSCQQQDEISTLATVDNDALAAKIAANANFSALFSEMASIGKEFADKKIKMSMLSQYELQRLLAVCKTEQDLEGVFSKISNNPQRIMASIRLINQLMSSLDNDVHFTNLNNEKRSDVFQKAIALKYTANKIQEGVSSRARPSSDCVGMCSQGFNQAITTAGQNLALGAALGWAGGMFGGPAGMAVGALTIVGSIGYYYIAESAAFNALDSCVTSCYNQL